MSPIEISHLTEIFTSKKTGKATLHQSKITDWSSYETFTEFVEDFLARQQYPTPQSSKTETYGFCATHFMPGLNHPKPGREPEYGNWRIGEYAPDAVTLLIMDCDNADESLPYLTLSEVEDILSNMGLNYLLYTSYSDTPQKPKFRIMVQPDRDLTIEEAYDGARWFNERLGHQLDLTIYDPGDFMYGPPYNSDFRMKLDGGPLEAEMIVTGLPPRETVTHGVRRQHTPQERSRIAAQSHDLSHRPEISIGNTSVCPPMYIERLRTRYKGGSHSQSLMGVMTSLWLRNQAELSFGEMRNLARECDSEYGNYVHSKYGQGEVDRLIHSIMAIPVTPKPERGAYMSTREIAILKKFGKK